MLMELRLSHKTVGYHQKLTSLSLPALLPPPPSLLPTSVCLSLSSRHPTTTGCLYTIMAIGSFLSFPYVLCRIWSWYSSCKNTLSQRKEPCNVNRFKRPTSTLFLCLLAVRIFFTRCCWFNIYRCHGTQKVMTVVWGTMKLMLLRCVSWCECRLQSCLPSVRAQAADSSAARRGEMTSTMISCSLTCDFFFHPTSMALYHTTQLWPSKDTFLMFSHACCFQILLFAVKFILWARTMLLKTKFLHWWGNEWSGLKLDYFDNKVQFGRTSALIPHCVTWLWFILCIFLYYLYFQHDEAHRFWLWLW